MRHKYAAARRHDTDEIKRVSVDTKGCYDDYRRFNGQVRHVRPPVMTVRTRVRITPTVVLLAVGAGLGFWCGPVFGDVLGVVLALMSIGEALRK